MFKHPQPFLCLGVPLYAYLCVSLPILFLFSFTEHHISCRPSQTLDSLVWHSWTKTLFVKRVAITVSQPLTPPLTHHLHQWSVQHLFCVYGASALLWRHAHTHTHFRCGEDRASCGIYLIQARCIRDVQGQTILTDPGLWCIIFFCNFRLILEKSCVLTRAFKTWSISHITGRVSQAWWAIMNVPWGRLDSRVPEELSKHVTSGWHEC